MKTIIQRVTSGSVSVNDREVGKINIGYVVFVGFKKGDSLENLEKMAQKIINIRLFADLNNKMNKSIQDINGELLVIPQFTLCANTKKRRPSFSNSEDPELAKNLFNKFVSKLETSGLRVVSGGFGAHMLVDIHNDGPVTITLEE